MSNFLEKAEKFQLTILAVIISLGLIIGAKVITSGLSHDGIAVTGSAFEIVKSDSGKITFNISTQAKTKAEAYKIMKKQLPEVENFLKSKGITDIDIKSYNGYYDYKYNNVTGNYTNEIERFKLSQPVEATSKDVNLIKQTAIDLQALIDKGIDITEPMADYYYSGLTDLKIKLLKEATIDAKKRASAMLKANRNSVGKIQSVKMGVFQITDVDSTNVSDMGINDTSTIDKKVTAVANVVFKIK